MARPIKSLDYQEGHLTKKQIAHRQEVEAQLDGADRTGLFSAPPSGLRDDVALQIWKENVKWLETLDMIGSLDVDNIVTYCNLESEYREIMEVQKRYDIMSLQYDHLQKEKHKIETSKLAYAEKIGKTPESRMKLARENVANKQDEIETQFGAI